MVSRKATELRVAIADLGKGFRGGQRQACNLACGLKDRDIDVRVIGYPDGRLINKCREMGIVTYPASYDALTLVFDAYRIACDLKHAGVNVYQASETKAHMLGVMIKKFYHQLKVVVTSRTCLTNPSLLSKWFKYRTLAIDRYVAVCRAVKDHLTKVGVDDEKIEVIYSGFMPGYFNPCEREKRDLFVVGTACQLMEGKGVEVILKALGHARQKLGEFEFRVAGSGPLKDKFESMAGEYGISDNVRFLGFVEDMADFYRFLDVFVLASFSEGIAGSLIEAGSCGAVPVGSRVGGIPEVIDDGQNGFTFETGDSEQLADVLIKLAGDTDLRERMSRGFMRKKEIFNMERTLDDYLTLYQKLLSQ